LIFLYIKKFAAISKFSAWLVDGQYIRTHLDEEFTNFGQHFRFRFIPRNEFWIDHLHAPGEEHFYIDHLLVENRLMAGGLDYFHAHRSASHLEYFCRHHPRQLKKKLVEELRQNRGLGPLRPRLKVYK
jgi:hypothetical protein